MVGSKQSSVGSKTKQGFKYNKIEIQIPNQFAELNIEIQNIKIISLIIFEPLEKI